MMNHRIAEPPPRQIGSWSRRFGAELSGTKNTSKCVSIGSSITSSQDKKMVKQSEQTATIASRIPPHPLLEKESSSRRGSHTQQHQIPATRPPPTSGTISSSSHKFSSPRMKRLAPQSALDHNHLLQQSTPSRSQRLAPSSSMGRSASPTDMHTTGRKATPSPSLKAATPAPHPRSLKQKAAVRGSGSKTGVIPATKRSSSQQHVDDYVVRFSRGSLGMKLEAVVKSTSGEKGCKIVGFVDVAPHQSQARQCGKIHMGDIVVSIDGQMVLSKRYGEIVALLRKPYDGDKRTVTFRCVQDSPSNHHSRNTQFAANSKMPKHGLHKKRSDSVDDTDTLQSNAETNELELQLSESMDHVIHLKHEQIDVALSSPLTFYTAPTKGTAPKLSATIFSPSNIRKLSKLDASHLEDVSPIDEIFKRVIGDAIRYTLSATSKMKDKLGASVVGKKMQDYEHSMQHKRVLHNELSLAMNALGMDHKNIINLEHYVDSCAKKEIAKDTPMSRELLINEEKTTKENSEIRQQIEQIQSDSDTSLRRIKQRLDEKSEVISTLRLENDMLREKELFLEKKHKEIIEGLEEDHIHLKSDQKELQVKYNSAIQERNFHQGECAVIQQEHTKTLKSYEYDLYQTHEELATKNETFIEMELQIEALLDDKHINKEEYSVLENEVRTLRTHANELKTEITSLSTNNMNFHKELMEAKKAIDDQRSEKEELVSNEIQYFEDNLDKLESEYSGKLREKETELILMNTNFETCREECKEMECQLKKRNESVEDYVKIIEGSQLELDGRNRNFDEVSKLLMIQIIEDEKARIYISDLQLQLQNTQSDFKLKQILITGTEAHEEIKKIHELSEQAQETLTSEMLTMERALSRAVNDRTEVEYTLSSERKVNVKLMEEMDDLVSTHSLKMKDMEVHLSNSERVMGLKAEVLLLENLVNEKEILVATLNQQCSESTLELELTKDEKKELEEKLLTSISKNESDLVDVQQRLEDVLCAFSNEKQTMIQEKETVEVRLSGVEDSKLELLSEIAVLSGSCTRSMEDLDIFRREHTNTNHILEEKCSNYESDLESLRQRLDEVIDAFSIEKQSLINERGEVVTMHSSEILKWRMMKEKSIIELQRLENVVCAFSKEKQMMIQEKVKLEQLLSGVEDTKMELLSELAVLGRCCTQSVEDLEASGREHVIMKQNLEDKCSTYESDLETLRHVTSSVRRDMEEKGGEIEDLKVQYTLEQENLDTFKARCKNLEELQVVSVKKRNDLENNSTSLNSIIEQKDDRLEELNQHIVQLKAKLNSSTDELASLNHRLYQTDALMEEHREINANEFEILKAEMSFMQKERSLYEAEIEKKEHTLASEKETNTALSIKMNQFKETSLIEIENLKNSCDEKVKETAGPIMELQSEVKELLKMVEEKDSILALLEKRCNQSAKDLIMSKRENKCLEEDLETGRHGYEADLFELQLQLDDVLDSFSKEKSSLIKEHEELVHFLKYQNSKKGEEINQLKADLSSSSHELKSLENHLDERDMVISFRKEKENLLTVEEDILRSQILSLQETVDKQQGLLQVHRNEVVQSCNAIVSLESFVGSLKDSLSKCKHECKLKTDDLYRTNNVLQNITTECDDLKNYQLNASNDVKSCKLKYEEIISMQQKNLDSFKSRCQKLEELHAESEKKRNELEISCTSLNKTVDEAEPKYVTALELVADQKAASQHLRFELATKTDEILYLIKKNQDFQFQLLETEDKLTEAMSSGNATDMLLFDRNNEIERIKNDMNDMKEVVLQLYHEIVDSNSINEEARYYLEIKESANKVSSNSMRLQLNHTCEVISVLDKEVIGLITLVEDNRDLFDIEKMDYEAKLKKARNSTDISRTLITNLKLDLEGSEQRYEKLAQAKNNLNEKQEQLKNRYLSLTNANDKVIKELQIRNKETEESFDKLVSKKDVEIDQMRQEKAVEKKVREDKDAHCKNLDRVRNDLIKEKDELVARCVNMNGKMQHSEQKTESALQLASDHRTSKQALESEVQSLQKKFEDVLETKHNLSTLISSKEKEIDILSKDVDLSQLTIDTLEKQCLQNSSSLNLMKKEWNQAFKTTSSLEKEIVELSTSIEEERNLSDDQRKVIESIEADKVSLAMQSENKLIILNNTLSTLEKNSSHIIKEKENCIAKVKTSLELAEIDYIALEVENTELKLMSQQSKNRNRHLKRNYTVLEDSTTLSEATVNVTSNILTHFYTETLKLESTLDSFITEKDTMMLEIDSLKTHKTQFLDYKEKLDVDRTQNKLLAKNISVVLNCTIVINKYRLSRMAVAFGSWKKIASMKNKVDAQPCIENNQEFIIKEEKNENLENLRKLEMKDHAAKLIYHVMSSRVLAMKGIAFRRLACASSYNEALISQMDVVDGMALQLETTREKLALVRTHFGEVGLREVGDFITSGGVATLNSDAEVHGRAAVSRSMNSSFWQFSDDSNEEDSSNHSLLS